MSLDPFVLVWFALAQTNNLPSLSFYSRCRSREWLFGGQYFRSRRVPLVYIPSRASDWQV